MANIDSQHGTGSPDQGPMDAPQVGRRRFLHIVSGIGAALSAVVVGFPVVRAFVSPTLPSPPKDDWIKVAEDTALLDVGVPIQLNFVVSEQDAWIESRTVKNVWLFSEDGEKFKAYNGRCTHLGCGFVWDKDANNFLCPCHRGRFDLRTGAVLSGPPPRPLDELEVEIRDSVVFVKYKEFRLGIPARIEA
ncbi:MAG: Rieske 2Fe-2S domain-containing protein [Gemmatimonadaceae bacterium]|nr:Rieske 2Fe-2S domain-containing protein [Gemmatimonadaceae bacterium]